MNLNAKKRVGLICAAGIAWGLTSCAEMKAAPSKGAGFVPVAKMQQDPAFPFDKAWIQEGTDWQDFRSIYVKPVDTSYLLNSNWWQQNLRQGQINKDAQTVALYMQQRFKDAFRNDPQRRFRVVESPAPDSVTLELALTELVPSNVVMEAAAMAAPGGSGLAATALNYATGSLSTVAFEARVKDAKTGKVVAMFADREQPKLNPVDLKQLTWYAEANDAINDWADESVMVANKQPGQIISRTAPFSLKPW